MAGEERPDARGRGQLARGGVAESGYAAEPAWPPDPAGDQRRPHPREPQARRARREARARVRVRDAAAQDPGRLGLDGGASGHSVIWSLTPIILLASLPLFAATSEYKVELPAELRRMAG